MKNQRIKVPLVKEFNVSWMNKQEKFYSDEIRRCFRPLSVNEILALKKGDSLWLECSRKYLMQKVYGWKLILIEDVINLSKEAILIFHSQGRIVVPIKSNHGKLFSVDDPEHLFCLIRINPVSTKVI